MIDWPTFWIVFATLAASLLPLAVGQWQTFIKLRAGQEAQVHELVELKQHFHSELQEMRRLWAAHEREIAELRGAAHGRGPRRREGDR